MFNLEEDFDWGAHDVSLYTDPQVKDSSIFSMLGQALTGFAVSTAPFAYKTDEPGHFSPFLDNDINIALSMKPLTSEDGEIYCLICQATLMAESEESYDNELLRIQKGENLEILASGVAHEFNNIFTGIKGLTDLIKDEVDRSSEIYEFSESIQQNIARGAELIQQLSSFARQLPHSLRPRMVSAYIEKALPLMQIHLQRRIALMADVRVDGQVMIDSNRMDQAIANIMNNARDAMGGQGQVRITVDKIEPEPHRSLPIPDDTEWIMIEVADSGPGIPTEIQDRILEPFFSTKERGKATGLGLSVTNRIVISHGGIVQIGQTLFVPLAGFQMSIDSNCSGDYVN